MAFSKKKNINFLNQFDVKRQTTLQAGIKDKVKDFIIPHNGNNYQPQILHPQRVVFYTVTAVFMKILLLVFVLLLPIDAWLTPDMAEYQGKQLFILTNQYRQAKGLSPFKENDKLKKAADKKIKDMVNNQYFDHVSPQKQSLSDWLGLEGYQYEVAGENLAVGFQSAQEIFKNWLASPTHLANIIDPDFTEMGIEVDNGTINGSDTTLAVQIVASDKNEAQASKLPVLASSQHVNKINPKKIVFNKKNVSSSKVKNISRPTISLPENKIVQATTQAKITISAPQAEYLDTFVDGELVKQQLVKGQKTIDQEIVLAEGLHQLTVAANKGEERIFSQDYALLASDKPPVINKLDSSVIVTDSGINDNSKIIKARINISSDAKAAWLGYNNNKIELKSVGNNIWEGQGILTSNSENKTLTLANVVAVNESGQQTIADIGINNLVISPVKSFDSLLFFSDRQPLALKSVFEFTSIYYRILLVLAMLAMLLNIIFEINKQHPKVIFSTSSLIIILLMLIII